MSPKSTQTLYAALASLVFVVLIWRLGRSQKLSFRYAVGWLLLGALGVVAGLLAPLAEPVADYLSISPAALLAIGGMVLLLVLCVQLSISISGLQEQVRTLAEECAFLRSEIDDMRKEK